MSRATPFTGNGTRPPPPPQILPPPPPSTSSNASLDLRPTRAQVQGHFDARFSSLPLPTLVQDGTGLMNEANMGLNPNPNELSAVYTGSCNPPRRAKRIRTDSLDPSTRPAAITPSLPTTATSHHPRILPKPPAEPDYEEDDDDDEGDEDEDEEPPTPPPQTTSKRRGRKPGTLSRSARESLRKQNHSRIEKARRTKINDALATLRELVPVDYKSRAQIEQGDADEEGLDEGDADGDGDGKGKDKGKGKAKGKKEEKQKEFKLEVLVRTVGYLQDLIERVKELEVESGKKECVSCGRKVGEGKREERSGEGTGKERVRKESTLSSKRKRDVEDEEDRGEVEVRNGVEISEDEGDVELEGMDVDPVPPPPPHRKKSTNSLTRPSIPSRTPSTSNSKSIARSASNSLSNGLKTTFPQPPSTSNSSTAAAAGATNPPNPVQQHSTSNSSQGLPSISSWLPNPYIDPSYLSLSSNSAPTSPMTFQTSPMSFQIGGSASPRALQALSSASPRTFQALSSAYPGLSSLYPGLVSSFPSPRTLSGTSPRALQALSSPHMFVQMSSTTSPKSNHQQLPSPPMSTKFKPAMKINTHVPPTLELPSPRLLLDEAHNDDGNAPSGVKDGRQGRERAGSINSVGRSSWTREDESAASLLLQMSSASSSNGGSPPHAAWRRGSINGNAGGGVEGQSKSEGVGRTAVGPQPQTPGSLLGLSKDP